MATNEQLPYNQPIGIFDSGVGGLSVWKEIRHLMPFEHTIYFADTLNCPYGPQSNKKIIAYSEKAVEFLLDQQCKIIVVACNTATSAAIQWLRKKYNVPFVGMEPAVKPAAASTLTGKVGVLATEGTIKGMHFNLTKEKFAKEIKVIETIGTGLVELVESGNWETEDGIQLVKKYIEPMIEKEVDKIVLGCTHYPFLEEMIKKIIGSNIEILNPAPAVAKRTKQILIQKDSFSGMEKASSHLFYSSAESKALKELVSKLQITPFTFPQFDS